MSLTSTLSLLRWHTIGTVRRHHHLLLTSKTSSFPSLSPSSSLSPYLPTIFSQSLATKSRSKKSKKSSKALPKKKDEIPLFSAAPVEKTDEQNSSPTQESRWRRLKRLRRDLRKNGPPPNRPSIEFDRKQTYSVEEALKHVRACSFAKFDETLELILRLNIDPRRADHNLRGNIKVPFGSGRKDHIAVFVSSENNDDVYQSVLRAGAKQVGLESLIENVGKTKGRCFKGYTACIATRDVVAQVASQTGRILGPKGLLPSDKAGTVVGGNAKDIGEEVSEFIKGKVYYRTDKAGTLHMAVGKLSFDDQMLIENVKSVIRHVFDVKPTSVRKKYILKAVICSSMGPGVIINAEEILKRTFEAQNQQTSPQPHVILDQQQTQSEKSTTKDTCVPS